MPRDRAVLGVLLAALLHTAAASLVLEPGKLLLRQGLPSQVAPRPPQVPLVTPPPTELPSSPTETWREVKIVTGGDASHVADAWRAIENQRAFADRRGYNYEVHQGNYAEPWVPYWHKVDVLLRELRAPRPPEVLVWMDLDVIVTDPTQDMLERVLERHPEKEVVLTEDAQLGERVPGTSSAKRLVNTGVILVRARPDAERVLEALFEYGRQHRDAAYFMQDEGTLHEQDAFNALLGGERKHVWSRHVAVMPQRDDALNLNTFARNLYDEVWKDPPQTEWRPGDFTAHCTGLRRQLREWCIMDSAAAAQERLAAEAACRNETLPQILGPAALAAVGAEEASEVYLI